MTWFLTEYRLNIVFFQRITLWSAVAICQKIIHNHNEIYWGGLSKSCGSVNDPPLFIICGELCITQWLLSYSRQYRRLAGFIKQQCWKLLCYRILVQRKIDCSLHTHWAVTAKLHLPRPHFSHFTTIHSTTVDMVHFTLLLFLNRLSSFEFWFAIFTLSNRFALSLTLL